MCGWLAKTKYFYEVIDQGAIVAAVDVELTSPPNGDALILDGIYGQRLDHRSSVGAHHAHVGLLQRNLSASLSATHLFHKSMSMMSPQMECRELFRSSLHAELRWSERAILRGCGSPATLFVRALFGLVAVLSAAAAPCRRHPQAFRPSVPGIPSYQQHHQIIMWSGGARNGAG